MKPSHRTILSVALVLILALGVYVVCPANMGEAARRMSFIFVVAAFFWAFEIIPLYATALLIVLLEVFLLAKPGGVLGMSKNGYQIFLNPFADPIIMLFLGGFILADAVRKYELDQRLVQTLLKWFGDKPFFILLGFLLTGGILSMWMSNTATAALMLVMMRPLLAQINLTDPFRKALVLAIPFGANLGGIGTPVGSPPNAITMSLLSKQGVDIQFVSWMKMGVPLALGLLVLTSLILYILFPAQTKKINFTFPSLAKTTMQQYEVLFILGATVLLWLTTNWHHIPEALIALLAAGGLMSLRLMNVQDLKNTEWDLLVLMWGGLALGEGMEKTGLTQWIVQLPIFQQEGILLVGLFSLLTVVLSTFMSNTATANLMVPLVLKIPSDEKIFLAIMVGISCSLAMALPISTPPNALAFASQMIKSKDMFKAGICVSIVSLFILLIGYKKVLSWAL